MELISIANCYAEHTRICSLEESGEVSSWLRRVESVIIIIVYYASMAAGTHKIHTKIKR